MNHEAIQRIAGAVNVLRPEWPVASLITVLSDPELARRSATQVMVAMSVVACDRESRTPARVKEAGPWWKGAFAATGEEPPTPTPDPIRSRPCPEHPDQRMTRCEHCRPATPAKRPPNYAELVERARETNRPDWARKREHA